MADKSVDRFGRPLRPYKPMPTLNTRGENHAQFIARVNPPLPCTASYGTFGGRCLNCGFQPVDQLEINHG